MANWGNDWNSMMQTRQARIVMYGICVFFCVYYGVDAVMEMLSPERSANLMQIAGPVGYYAMTIVRAVVCMGTGIAFGRLVLKALNEEDEEDE